jgi:phage gpG-like protein
MASTIKIKGNDNVLIARGALEAGAKQLSNWQYDKEAAWVDSLPERVWYGVVHQEGGYAGRAGYLPPRPFMVLQEEDVDKLAEVFENWLEGKLMDFGSEFDQMPGDSME